MATEPFVGMPCVFAGCEDKRCAKLKGECIMARQKSEFVSAIGVLFEIVKALAEEVYALGGSDNDLRRILKEHELRRNIAKLLVANISDAYPIDVPSSTISDLVRSGRYDWSNSDINDSHFKADEPHQAEVILRHFGKDMSTDNVLKVLDAEGLRPATMSELLTLGIKYPQLQMEFPIVELGSVWQLVSGHRFVGYLHRFGQKRKLYLNRFGFGWYKICRFAAVRK